MIRLIKNSFGNKCITIKNDIQILVSEIQVYKNQHAFVLTIEINYDTIIINAQILNKEKIFYQIFRNGKNIYNVLDDYDDQLQLWINSQ